MDVRYAALIAEAEARLKIGLQVHERDHREHARQSTQTNREGRVDDHVCGTCHRNASSQRGGLDIGEVKVSAAEHVRGEEGSDARGGYGEDCIDDGAVLLHTSGKHGVQRGPEEPQEQDAEDGHEPVLGGVSLRRCLSEGDSSAAQTESGGERHCLGPCSCSATEIRVAVITAVTAVTAGVGGGGREDEGG